MHSIKRLFFIGLICTMQLCSGMKFESKNEEKLPWVDPVNDTSAIKGSIASPLYNLKGTYQVVADDYKHLSLLNGAVAWESGYIEKY